MTSYEQVHTPVFEVCCATVPPVLPGVKIYPDEPDSPTLPAIIVRPGSPVDRARAGLSSRSSKWNLEVLLLMGRVNELAAKKRAQELLSPDSELRLALRNLRVVKGFLVTDTVTTGEQRYRRGFYEGGLIKLKGMA